VFPQAQYSNWSITPFRLSVTALSKKFAGTLHIWGRLLYPLSEHVTSRAESGRVKLQSP
jgi:hypothetical protein